MALSFWRSVYDAVLDFSRLETSRMAAALSFYVTLSFAPLALVFLFVAGSVDVNFAESMADYLGEVVGPGAGDLAREVRLYAIDHPNKSILSGLTGFLALVFASSVAYAIEKCQHPNG